MDINLGHNRGYLKNLHIAQLIKYAEIKKNHKVLHVGALTGYVTSLLSDLSYEVFAIEEDKYHLTILKNNMINIDNVKILDKSFKLGNVFHAPFDRIIIDCPLKKIDKALLGQLSEDSGQIIMIEKNQDNLSKAMKITNKNNNFSKEFLFDVFSNYELYEEKEGFVF